jgi:hypothetical protein
LCLLDRGFVVVVAADHERRENRIDTNGRHDVPIAGREIGVEEKHGGVSVSMHRERLEDSAQRPPRSVHVGGTGHETCDRLAESLERGEPRGRAARAYAAR